MQRYKFHLSIACILLLLSSCKQNGSGGSSGRCPSHLVEYYADSMGPPSTGRLTLTVYDKNCDYLPNTWVIVYATYQDYLNDIRLNEGFTNNAGYIDLAYLNAGNYYLYIQAPMIPGDTNVYFKVEVAQVQTRMRLAKRVIFENYDRP